MTYTIDEIIAKNPKTEKGQELNNTAKRKIGVAKLADIEYLQDYDDEQKNAVLKLKKAFANNSMKSYQQLKLYSNELESVKNDLIELAEAIKSAENQDVLNTVLKLYLSA